MTCAKDVQAAVLAGDKIEWLSPRRVDVKSCGLGENVADVEDVQKFLVSAYSLD